MPMNFKIILEKFLTEELTPEELSFFLVAVREPANESILLATVGDKLNSQAYQGLSIKAKMPEMWQAMLDKAVLLNKAVSPDDSFLSEDITVEDDSTVETSLPLPDRAAYPSMPLPNAGNSTHWRHIAPARRIFPFRQIAAAVLLLLAGGTGLFIWFNKRQQAMALQTSPESRFKNDIAPGGNKAILTLANGHTILLDSSSNGTLARQGNTSIVKLNSGQLAYQPASDQQTDYPSAAAALSYNTLSTPRGGQYQLTLPDGSKVWLNAASSIRYPTAFTGKERKVEISGEAYFEIAKNAAQPFKVKIIAPAMGGNASSGYAGAGSEIEVLGTSFNIMAYEDDTVASTTLLEGAVKVTIGANSRTLSPGQQLKAGNKGSIQLIPDVDIQKTIAWKNGKFIFYNDDIVSIMKQLTRWYDIDVRMEQMVHDHYTGRISRQVNISQVLKMMEAAGGVSFSVQGKEVKIN